MLRRLVTDPEERPAADLDARGGRLQEFGAHLSPHVVDGPRGRAGEATRGSLTCGNTPVS